MCKSLKCEDFTRVRNFHDFSTEDTISRLRMQNCKKIFRPCIGLYTLFLAHWTMGIVTKYHNDEEQLKPNNDYFNIISYVYRARYIYLHQGRVQLSAGF